MPQPVGPMTRMLDLATSTTSSLVCLPAAGLEAGLDPLVVVVDRDGERLLGVLLADDVGVEELEDLPRLGQLVEADLAALASSSSMISLHSSMHSSQM